ncbi:MAG: metal-dependent hydrolase [Lachnospiraceae bacterium]|nr:metal-dependent hydrolase [Lachnospiraceae bacterium]
MQGKTHIAVGTALSVALMRPGTLPVLAAGIAVSAVGSILCDIDAGPSGSRNGAVSAGAVILILLSCLFLMDSLLQLNLLSALTAGIRSSSAVLALPAFILFCCVGILSGHRAFTHSFLALGIYSACIYFLLPGYIFFFVTGYASHLFLDSLNFRGIMLLYPVKTRYSMKLCRSDGIVNSVLFAAGVIALVILVYESEGVRALILTQV